jgi:serine protease Do
MWHMSGRITTVLVLVTAAFFTVSCGNGGSGRVPGTEGTVLPSAAKTLDRTLGASTISDVAEKTVDSVVNISTVKTVRVERGAYGLPLDDPFFRRFFGPEGRNGRPDTRRESSLGSGVIVSSDGVILTNNHVVRDADQVTVILHDNRKFDAKVVGADPASDLAVIRIDKKVDGLRPLPFGDSDKLRLGEVVLAIGNPFGLSHTVTMGIVSAKGRSNVGVAAYEDFIQTDAAINPGNSGGALINLRGELVGVNTAIASSTGEYQGIGFAIPANMAKSIMGTLAKGGKIVRGWIGVGLREVTPDIAEAIGLKKEGGALVGEVFDDGPGKKAGLQPGDVILAVDGKSMENMSHLRNTIAGLGANKRVTLRVFRDGREINLPVTLGERPENPEIARGGEDRGGKMKSFGGLAVSSLNMATRETFQIPDEVTSGVVVTGIQAESAAEQAGLQMGDVIRKINNRPAGSVDAVIREYERAKNKVLLYVWREGSNLFLVLEKK